MTDTHYEAVFGGIDRNATDAERAVPTFYRDIEDTRRGESVEFPTFHEALTTLRERFPCETRTVAYEDDDAGEWVEDDRFQALVNPEWLGDGRRDAPQDNALWQVVTDSYNATDHMDAFGPLCAVARQNDLAATFGTVRTYRNGGEVQIDILFDGLRAGVPDAEDDPILLGFSLGQDYFRSQSVHASVIAVDERTGTVMRGLTDTFSTPHSNANAAEDVAEWLSTMFERAEKVGDTLYEVVAEAREYEVAMNEVPLSVAEFYEALGFPGSMAQNAADRVRNKNRPAAYDLYLPIAQELTENYEAKVSGDALTSHATRANDLLFAPPSAERSALRHAAEDLQGQGTLGAEYGDAAEQIHARIEDLDEAVSAFENVRDRIRTMLQETANGEDSEPQSAENTDASDEVDA